MLTTIVYSAFNTRLLISGEAVVRSTQEIRVTNLRLVSQTNGAYETYNNKYTKQTTSMFATLPSNSSITYEVEITDKGDVGYIVQAIEQISNTNPNVKIDIGLKVDDLIEAETAKKFNVVLTNTTSLEQVITLVLKYSFIENKYIVTFNYDGGYDDNSLLVKYDAANRGTDANKWKDLSGNGRDGIIYNGVWGTDYLEFDGSTSYVDLGRMDYGHFIIDITFSSESLRGYIIANHQAGGTSISFNYQGILYAVPCINGEYKLLILESPILANTKYRAVSYYDGKTARFFVDGNLVASFELVGAISPPYDNTIMALGGNPNGPIVDDGYFKGKIYKVAIYQLGSYEKVVNYRHAYGQMPTPTKEGFTFLGWYYNDIKVDSNTLVNVKSDHVLTAKWQEK